MLTREKLANLRHSLESESVLTVYIDTSAEDPALRQSWRVQLEHGLKDLRTWLGDSPRTERLDFDRCVALLERELTRIGGLWSAPGWVAFITADGVREAHALPVVVPTLAVFSTGICAAPYVRALNARRPVVVAVADARKVTLYRYASGLLDRVETLRAHHATSEPSHPGSAMSPRFHAATRGAQARDRNQQALRAGRERMLAEAAARIRQLAAPDAWIVAGGIPRVVAQLTRALAPAAPHRVFARTALDVHATEAEIAAAARAAASTLHNESTAVRVAEIAEVAAAGGLGAVGPHATERALERRCVGELYLTGQYLDDNLAEAESFVRAALDQNALIEEISGQAATYLDEHGGVAARLRWRAASPGPAVAAAVA